MRKIYTGFFIFCISLLLSKSGIGQVVISQVYGGGGNAGASYKNDFIELFNPGTTTINLSGWSVQYASSTGSSWQVTALTGSIAPGQYFLIQESAGTGGTVDLPAPDATGTINMSGTAGKVALSTSTVALSGTCPVVGISDFVGFGAAANCFEGTGPTPAPSNTNAVLRINNGCTDNGSNAADFTAGAPNPRNTASPLNSCAVCTAPTNQAIALLLTPAISSIAGSFTAAAAGTVPADNYLVLISTSNILTQQPVVGNPYTAGSSLGNAQIVSASAAVSFTAAGLNAASTYYFFIYSYTSAGNCYNLSNPLTGSIATEANPAPTVSVTAGNNAAEPASNGSFNISLSAPAPTGGVAIGYTLGGTAGSSDYTDPQNGTITIAEGNSSGTITLNTADDAIAEPAKTITIALNTASNGYLINTAAANISLTDDDIADAILLSSSYTQDFNTLASAGTAITWTDNATIPGWYASRVVYNTSTGSSNAGALYSFGSTASAERALGSVGSGSTSTVYYGARFKNNTGTAITSLKIIYTGEQWRNGGNASAQTVNFAYQSGTVVNSLTSGVWTPVSSLNFTSPVTGAAAATLDGNLLGTNAIIVIYTINSISIPAGEEIMIRWEDADHGGADHGLAIDDFSIEANPADFVAPLILTLSPANNAADVSTNTAATISFDETIFKGTGNILVKKSSDNSTVQTIDVSTAAATVAGSSISFSLSGLVANTNYYVEIDNGAFEDLAGNDFAGITGSATWSFTTGTNFYVANFQTCSSSITDGFTQYSVTGAVLWGCTAFGRDPAAPAGVPAYPYGVQMNGFSGGTNTPNVDWLISPSLNLTGTTYPLLSFWSRTAFNGLPLQLKVSTDYVSGDPGLATWTDINGKFPALASNIWTASADINLSAFKQVNVHFAFVYTSSDDDGARWTLDDISVANSPTPPPPSLTAGTTDIQFSYVAGGATADKTFSFTGNDLTGDVSLVATGDFLLSKNGSSFSSSVVYTQAEANDLAKTVYVRFAPAQNNQNFTGTVVISTASLSVTVNLKGTSIDPLTTLEVVNWNIEWFGSTLEGPTNENQQEQNVKTILQNINADVYALVEVVDEARLASVVSQMPGYAYVISNYGSYSNPNATGAGPLSAAQKMAFVYKTSVLSNISTEALLSVGINSPEDISNPNYNYWASGRFPFMMSADVTLNCITKPVRFVLVHAKANTSPTDISYARRKNGADALYNQLNGSYPEDNILILGDFNDDLDVSITSGFTVTSWNSFTEDATNYSALTLPLSLAGKKSTVAYNDIIDHVIASSEMQAYYMDATANVLNDVTGLVSNYGNSTSDHYPVFTRYIFTNTTAPVINSCPVVSPLCAVASNTYTIPVFTATDDCDVVRYSYVISGTTQRSGNSNNASGIFNAGTSTIVWTAADNWGNSVTCSTTVVVNNNPAVTIPDAFALPSGTLANTVYIGYNPAASIVLNPVVTGGTPAYSYAWSNGASTASATVNPVVNTSYTLTVTDINGCQAQAGKTVLVKDVRAGNNGTKVNICHKPNAQNNTLVVNQGEVSSHLSHGDLLGSCNTVNFPSLTVGAVPNPSINYFTVTVKGGNPAVPISLRVINIFGKTIEQRTNLQSNQSVQIGGNYPTGIYFVEVSRGAEKAYSTLLKIRL